MATRWQQSDGFRGRFGHPVSSLLCELHGDGAGHDCAGPKEQSVQPGPRQHIVQPDQERAHADSPRQPKQSNAADMPLRMPLPALGEPDVPNAFAAKDPPPSTFHPQSDGKRYRLNLMCTQPDPKFLGISEIGSGPLRQIFCQKNLGYGVADFVMHQPLTAWRSRLRHTTGGRGRVARPPRGSYP